MNRRAIAILFAIMMTVPPLFVSGQTVGDELVLRVAMQDDIRGLNPITASDVWSWNVLGYIYDRPMGTDPETDEPIPYIAVGSANLTGSAASWLDCAFGNFGYSPQHTWENQSLPEVIIFYDFENVVWHDGHQMDIRDVLFSLHAAAQVPDWSSSMDILKADNFTLTSWLNVYKVWESGSGAALRFQLQEPFADFFTSTLSTLLLPEHVWACRVSGQAVDHAAIWCDPGYSPSLADSWKLAPAEAYENYPPVGSGLLKFDYWYKGQALKMQTFREHFFNENFKYVGYVGTDEYGRSLARQPEIDAVLYKIYKTAEAAVLALKAADIDCIGWSVPPTFLYELNPEPGIAVQQTPENGFTYLAYNMREKSFGYGANGDDRGKALRRAIAHCIDKNRIVTRLLLNLGIAGDGPVSPISPWYNKSIPRYSFDPDMAKRILADNGYLVEQYGNLLSGDLAIAAAGNGNWWVNPDGTPIGSGEGGLIEILTPESNYDPRSTNEGLMIAQQLRDIGIYAESVAMDFGSIVDRIDNHDFDMYLLRWNIGTQPDDYLHAFYHSGQINVQNYAGYQNTSFDELIDLARSSDDQAVKKKAVMDALAAICYDLPNDVLYFKTRIEAYRSDRFVGWEWGGSGSMVNVKSLRGIHPPGPYKLNAQFVSPPSAIVANSSHPITVFVKDQDGNPISGARVMLNASIGKLDKDVGNTTSSGKFTVTFTAPYVDPNDKDAVQNGTNVIIQIVTATYISVDGTIYNPAPSRITMVKVFPVNAEFLSVTLSADPDVIDPDIMADGTPGFTYIEVTVTDQNLEAVTGASVALTAYPDVPTIVPADLLTDAEGKATFKVVSADLTNDDGSEVQYSLKAVAIHPSNSLVRGENSITISVVDDGCIPPPPPPHPEISLVNLGIVMGAVTVAVAAIIYAIRRELS